MNIRRTFETKSESQKHLISNTHSSSTSSRTKYFLAVIIIHTEEVFLRFASHLLLPLLFIPNGCSHIQSLPNPHQSFYLEAETAHGKQKGNRIESNMIKRYIDVYEMPFPFIFLALEARVRFERREKNIYLSENCQMKCERMRRRSTSMSSNEIFFDHGSFELKQFRWHWNFTAP